MSSNSKKILISIFCLCSAILIVIAQSGRGKKAGQPYTASCTSKKDRCQKCKIYELQMKRMQGVITQEEFLKQSADEEKYISLNCFRFGGGGGGDFGRRGDKCAHKRNFDFRIEKDGKLVFYVYRNEFIKGECIPNKKKKTDVLEIPSSPIKNYSNYNRYFEFDFVSYSNPSDINMPFSRLSGLAYAWLNQSYDLSYPDSSFAFLIPDSVTNRVYLIKPESKGIKKGTISKLPESISPRWFNYYDTSNKEISFLFDDLIAIFAHDPNAKVIKELTVDSPNVKKLIVSFKGFYKGKSFFLTTGFSNGKYLGLYNPFQLVGENILSGNIVSALITPNIDERIKKIVQKFSNEGIEEKIVAVLPSSYSKRLTPKSSIGSPLTSECLTEEIKKNILDAGFELDLLTKVNDNYYSWKNGFLNHQKVLWLKAEYSKFCQLRYLAIIDSDLKIIASSNSNSLLKLIFFFKDSFENLYCWTIKDKLLKEKNILNARNIFQLTGVSCLDYLKNLKRDLGNVRERDFFLAQSDINSFVLLDGFNLENKDERIILWTSQHEPSVVSKTLNVEANKIGVNASESKLKFFIADNYKELSWNVFKSRYSKVDWIRAKIYSLNTFSEHLPIDCWLSNGNRFGLCKYRNSAKIVSVYLDNELREVYGEKAFSEILHLIKKDEIIYNGNNSQPTDKEFFESCLAPNWNNWNKNVWRANPLGYFDRKN